MKNKSAAFLFGFVVFILAVIWYSRDWTWSTIDDPGFVIWVRDSHEQSGALVGSLHLIRELFELDQTWGLFRPSYWIYPSLFYWLPTSGLHLLRFVMLLVAVLGPLVAFRRRGITWPAIFAAGLIVAAASSFLANGLFFLSLQELSGAAFLGLGLMARSGWGRIGLWVVAAWFKSPFSWILIAEAIVLWRAGKRAESIVSGFLGLGTLLAAAIFARFGEYTARYGLDLWRILTNSTKLVEVSTVLVLVLCLWWIIVTSTTLTFNSLSFVLFFGFAGYTLQMLPWAVSGYYMGPIVYLLGLFLASMVAAPALLSKWQWLLAFSGPVVIAVYVLSQPLAQGFRMNSVLNEITSCLGATGSGTVVVTGHLDYVTTEEGVIRMSQIASLEGAAWAGTLRLAGLDSNHPTDRLLCSAGPIALYRA